jgi:hypothetical protein
MFRDFGNQPRVVSQGQQTNAGDQTVHADTGNALVAANAAPKHFEVRAIFGGSVAAVWQIARRNAANSADIAPVLVVYSAAGQSSQLVFATDLLPTERIVIRNLGALAGTSSAILQSEELT